MLPGIQAIVGQAETEVDAHDGGLFRTVKGGCLHDILASDGWSGWCMSISVYVHRKYDHVMPEWFGDGLCFIRSA